MASYHMCCKVISRGQGRSATAAAAYRAAERICDRRIGLEHDRAYVDCRSYEARGIDRAPTVHEGPAVRASGSAAPRRAGSTNRSPSAPARTSRSRSETPWSSVQVV